MQPQEALSLRLYSIGEKLYWIQKILPSNRSTLLKEFYNFLFTIFAFVIILLRLDGTLSYVPSETWHSLRLSSAYGKYSINVTSMHAEIK